MESALALARQMAIMTPGLSTGTIGLKKPSKEERPVQTYELRWFPSRVDQPSVMVKAEFFAVPDDLLPRYKSRDLTQAKSVHVPTLRPYVAVADPDELVIDKIHALSLRERLKYRDIYDLWWLREGAPRENLKLPEHLCARLRDHQAMYKDSRSLQQLFDAAKARLATASDVAMDRELSRFVPFSLNTEMRQQMLSSTAQLLSELEAVARMCPPGPAPADGVGMTM